MCEAIGADYVRRLIVRERILLFGLPFQAALDALFVRSGPRRALDAIVSVVKESKSTLLPFASYSLRDRKPTMSLLAFRRMHS